jgi:hypothetical protein
VSDATLNETPARPPEPSPMTHLQREEEIQVVLRALPYIPTADLRRLRAWLLDMIEKHGDRHRDICTLRGELVHAEVQRREAPSMLKKLGKMLRTADVSDHHQRAWKRLTDLNKVGGSADPERWDD